MKAAGLKAIDTVVSSTAILVKSKNPSNPALVDLLASRIRGVISRSLVPSHRPSSNISQLHKNTFFASITLKERDSPKQPRSHLERERQQSTP